MRTIAYALTLIIAGGSAQAEPPKPGEYLQKPRYRTMAEYCANIESQILTHANIIDGYIGDLGAGRFVDVDKETVKSWGEAVDKERERLDEDSELYAQLCTCRPRKQ